jgi:hypothetical protein
VAVPQLDVQSVPVTGFQTQLIAVQTLQVTGQNFSASVLLIIFKHKFIAVVWNGIVILVILEQLVTRSLTGAV